MKVAFQSALLTGATGLIGGEIAHCLFQQVKDLTFLIRPKSNFSPEQRLQQRFNESSVKLSQFKTALGDIRLKNLGLASPELIQLTETIDLIVHCAAETSFLSDTSCELTNVQGTLNMLEFARRCKKKPLFVYISTASNSGKVMNSCLKEEEGCQTDKEHHNKYTFSKAVSEKMISASGLETLILRPSVVLSSGIQNRAFARQILWFVPLLKEFTALPMNPDAYLDIVPVSFFKDCFSKLLLKKSLQHEVYHISSGTSSLKVKDWVNLANLNSPRRYPLLMIHPEDWGRVEFKHYIKTDLQRKLFFALKYYLPFINMNTVFDHSRLKEELGDLIIPPVQTYLDRILNLIQPEEALQESLSP